MTARRLFDALADRAAREAGVRLPRLAARAERISFIREPPAFLAALEDGIAHARRRVVLMSLYLGTGAQERGLAARLHDALARNRDLTVDVVLDHQRGLRGGPANSSVAVLLPLKAAFGDRVRLSLFHSSKLNGLAKRLLPERFNEIPGLFHVKAYVFDDDVIVSGANLSDLYFGARQDRYTLLRDNAGLAHFFVALSATIRGHSYDATDRGPKPLMRNEPHAQPQAFSERVGADLRELLDKQSHAAAQATDAAADTTVIPLLQLQPAGITVDQALTRAVFAPVEEGAGAAAGDAHTLHISSGYFNMTSDYLAHIIASAAASQPQPKRYNVLTAAPEANGFFGSRGVSYWVPHAYTHIELEFLQQVQRAGVAEHVRLFEYVRPRWTFHAKGVWYHLPREPLPSMTLIGSPNYGYRSVHRDFEAQFMIITTDPGLRQRMDEERRWLFEGSRQHTLATLQADPSRHLPSWVPYVTRIIQRYF